MADVKCFAVTISTDEAYDDTSSMIKGGDSGIKKLSKMPGFIGVHPDPRGFFFAFLFRTPKARNEAYNEACKIFKTAAVMLDVVYVDEKYLN